jgi:hypothetical protein
MLTRQLALFLLIALLASAAHSQVFSSEVVRSPIELHFRDFFRLPVGPRGADISETLRQADGQSVTLVGYMVHHEIAMPGHFLLTPRPVQLSEHADGEADDLPLSTVLVYLDPSQQDWTVPHVRGLVSLTGVLSVGRREAQDGRVSWVRLQLPAAATSRVGAVAQAPHQSTPSQTH